MQTLLKSLRFLFFAFVALLLLFCILFAVLQSKWAKSQIREKLIAFFKEKGIAASIDEVGGRPPFLWTVHAAELSYENQRVSLEDIRCRLAIFPLLRGKIAIDYLKIEKAHICIPTRPSISFRPFVLPFPLAINYLKISETLMESGPFLRFATQGSINARKALDEFLLSLQFSSIEKPSTSLSIKIDGSRSKNSAHLFLATHQLPLPFLQLSGEATMEMGVVGQWESWSALIAKRPLQTSPLMGEIKGVLSNTRVPKIPLLDRTWKLLSQFHIPSTQNLEVHNFLLSSNLLHLKGKADLNTEIEKSQAILAFSLPNLSLFPSKFPLKGNAKGKAFYQEGSYKTSFHTQDLSIAAHRANHVKGLIKGNIGKGELSGSATIASSDAEIPFENAFAFKFVEESHFSLRDFRLNFEEGDIKGNLTYDTTQKTYEGVLDAALGHIDRFGGLFNEEYIGGNIGIYGKAWSVHGEQNLNLSLMGKNMRYREQLLEKISVSATLSDLFHFPSGRFHLLADNFYSPHINIERATFGTTSEEEGWPFFLDVNGTLEHPFQCYAKGFGLQEKEQFSLELTALTGHLSEVPFALRYPSQFEWGTDFINLSPFDFQIGGGSLYTHFELSPVRSLGKWDLKHFPLQVLSSFRPHMNLSGCISTAGFIDASPDAIQGAWNGVIEKADFLHFGKNEPFKTKGSIQAHLDKSVLQVHTDLHAIDEQFLDFNATLPIEYTLFPFKIHLDKTKPTAAELIAEGKLEDLFDFVNLGMNHLTGMVSSRLFLSRSLETPSLQGTLAWHNGTYENYFTGVSLRGIQAQLEAESDTLHLRSFSAKDEGEGTLSAEGKILLDPQEYFPYSFNAEEKNLHALRFDMIDCNLTGPLYFTGNLKSALAQGNLLIDSAKIQLTEQLPYEIPTLPVTFIHRPPHLLSQNATAEPNFQFHIDLELTADNKVFVEGRGLNAELEGNVHLTGTNTNIAAEGALKLIKGEYQFSGKIFKLTEGEIIFNDKPTPSAYLNLVGTLSLPSTTITATLSGSLTHPQLTFHSNPQMSTSSILALILFNKDISDISHPEAIQLASTLMSLSGGAGPDVLDTIRKTIGVDRLNIVSSGGDSDAMAVQIGKYLTRGVLITLSQSATSTQVIVEVELPQGFVFQAETQEEQEGKFSLKWTKSY